MKSNIKIDNGRIKKFCDKWDIVEFSLFGSVLRNDFGPESDVDFELEGVFFASAKNGAPRLDGTVRAWEDTASMPHRT